MASSLSPLDPRSRPIVRPLIAGNWKRHGMAPQLAEITAITASVKAAPPFADLLICLPATLIARAAQAAAGRIAIGGEDCSAEVSGAFTGDISAEMLKSAGAAAVILYGGSVNPSNAHDILVLPEVGGALVGGASLKAGDFEGIFRAMSGRV
jgi:triosephosphate isomerase